MMEDIKKYQKAEKLKKQREDTQAIPWYYDGLENLCDRIHPGEQLLRITDINALSHDTKLFRFISAKKNKPLAPFRAGQYIGLTVEINGVRTSRPYSLVSSPNQLAYYELGIRKKEDGFVSPYIFENSKVGDIFEITEPLGNLYYNPLFHGKDLVYIAGGCGITPLISMLRDISERAIPLNISLIYGCLTEKDILFRDELEDIQKRRSNIKTKFILSEPEPDWKGECGFITRDKILNEISSIRDKYFYIVGNRPMYQFIKEEMKELGIPKHRIYYEAFGVPDDITQVMGWPTEINSSNKVKISIEFRKYSKTEKIEFEAFCIEPLLNSLERTKNLALYINKGCRSGECALCRTKMVSGKVFVPPEVTIREVDKDFGFIHPCISYPLTDIHLDLTLT
ncbi:MAG: flavin reductase family protein [Promethearchaeota archaeon]|jgi:ferredoxin-NADP reductase